MIDIKRTAQCTHYATMWILFAHVGIKGGRLGQIKFFKALAIVCIGQGFCFVLYYVHLYIESLPPLSNFSCRISLIFYDYVTYSYSTVHHSI